MENITELQKKHQDMMREKREAVKARKERAHRLIQRGAMIEKIIVNSETMSNEEFEIMLERLVDKDADIAPCHPQDSFGRNPR